MKVNDPGGAIEAARALLSRGCGAVVVTLGANGAVYVDNDRVLVVPGLSVPVVDTVAAGDAFCGAFASALARGEGVEDGLARATAAGALAVGVAGATSSLPRAKAVDQLLSRSRPIGIRRLSPPVA